MKNLKNYLVLIAIIVIVIVKWEYVVETFTNTVSSIPTEVGTPPITKNNKAVEKPTTHNGLPPVTPTKPKRRRRNAGQQLPTLSSTKIVTWNLYNIGISKDDEEVAFIAKMLKDYDIIAIQEISTKLSGPRAIVKLKDELNRRGSKWDYIISDPTSGSGSERYAYLWRTNKFALSGRAWLVKARSLDTRLSREPYMARFKAGDNSILMANFHAVPTSKNPAQEIQLLDELQNLYSKDNLVILGDFNLSQKSKAFEDLKKKGFQPVVVNQKTSLRRIKRGSEYLAQEYDNIFYETARFSNRRSGIIDFVPHFKSLKEARAISDHVPVWSELKWK